ncbi:MAG: branched-chain amino acid transport system ATP-binding protein livM, partial [Actinomycetota bacterium]|nr:branched-chain amino acid transport system ATP-binding protein livM [Actinomycetota bacterium]
MTASTTSASIPRRVNEGLRASGAEFARAWQPRHTLIAALILLAAVVPAFVEDSLPIRAIASVLFYALAAVGLNTVMGLGNMASIGHGAFVAIGALTSALLASRTSMPLSLIILVATSATALAAYVVGHGAVRLRAVQLAVSSWLGAWLVALFLSGFPQTSGGAAGIPVHQAGIGEGLGLSLRATPLALYEIALVLLILGCIAFRSLQIGPVGLTLATIKQNPREAATIGTLRDDLRLGVFVFGATLAGLAGAFIVQLSGIFDQSAYGVLLSVSLFIAVLLGGPGRVVAPLIGAVVIALLPLPGQPIEPLITIARSGELLPGALLLTVVALRAIREVGPATAHDEQVTEAAPGPGYVKSPPLGANDITKTFGGVVALDQVALEAEGGVIHGLIGPNGSGKSTLLTVISGHAFPDTGNVSYDGADITSLPALDRLRLGISRSPQSTELFPELDALDHMIAARLVHRQYAGFFRSLFRTPLARLEERVARAQAMRSLREFGLESYAKTPAASMPAGARRTLMIAIAAAGKRVVLLDEPSAGMSAEETRRIAEILIQLKERGTALVVVEHNLRLLGRIADVVTVLDGGR